MVKPLFAGKSIPSTEPEPERQKLTREPIAAVWETQTSDGQYPAEGHINLTF